MSWEEAGGAGNARKGYFRFRQVLGCDRGSLVAIEFGPMSRQGFPVSQHGYQAASSYLIATKFSHVETVSCFSAMTMSRQRFPRVTETATTRG